MRLKCRARDHAFNGTRIVHQYEDDAVAIDNDPSFEVERSHMNSTHWRV
ncbi:hypothetical protein AWB81_05880 [Caballeronia arationis]|nr:hypothetical protein AWB81_05880 [Caballeronia arationis]